MKHFSNNKQYYKISPYSSKMLSSDELFCDSRVANKRCLQLNETLGGDYYYVHIIF